MVLVASSPIEAALKCHYESTLSQVGDRPDMTLDVVRT